MKKYFNLSRYKELLKLQENGEISFLDLEVLSLKASVAQQMCYNRKNDYFILIDKYLSQIISPYEFRSKFLQMEKEDSEKATLILENIQELEVLTLANDLEKYSDLIGQISTLCFEYYEVWDGTREPMSESEFYNLVNNSYLQLQKAFPVLSSKNLAYENLISRSFKILILSIGLGILLNLMRF